MAGLQFTSAKQNTWSVIPEAQVDLDYAIAGVTSASGSTLVAGWSRTSPQSLELAIKAPTGTHGKVGVPILWSENQSYEVQLNGQIVARGRGYTSFPTELSEPHSVEVRPHSPDSPRHLVIERVGEGNHFFRVEFK